MGFKRAPAPNAYSVPGTMGQMRPDPTRATAPAYSLRARLHDEHPGLGPGMYRLRDKTRTAQGPAPSITMAPKTSTPSYFKSPGPAYYKPEKCYNAKQNPPQYTMAKMTKSASKFIAPSANTYKLPSTLGPKVPDKHCNGAYSMGLKLKTPRGQAFPAPNKYKRVSDDAYKPAAPRITMGMRSEPRDKMYRPAPNSYYPGLPHKLLAPQFSFGRHDSDTRVVYLTRKDARQ